MSYELLKKFRLNKRIMLGFITYVSHWSNSGNDLPFSILEFE